MKCFLFNVVIPLDELKTIAFNIVGRSQFPIIVSLDLAHVFKKTSARNLLQQKDFLEMYEIFSHYALSLLHSIESDHLSSIVLEVRDVNERSALSIALSDNNLIFLGDGKVSMILNTIYLVPCFMTKSTFGISESCYRRSDILLNDPLGRTFSTFRRL